MGIAGYISYTITLRSAAQQQRKYDDANINHMKYGIFNINTWKDKLTKIIVAEIQEFKIEPQHKTGLKSHVEGQLNTLVEKFNNQIRESNKNSTTGWIKQKLINAFVDVEKIKTNIPDYADTIVTEMTHDENQKKLKEVVHERISKYLDKTFEPMDLAEVQDIVKRTGKKNMKQASAYLAALVPQENQQLFHWTWVLIATTSLLFLISLARRGRLPAPYFFICIATLLLLLYVGVTRPMIDMVAKISSFNFMLFGHHIEFKNQIVYFQSKSILDVFWILMENPDIQMKIVGLLMILFSVVFPLIKILSSLLYYYNVLNCQNNRIIQFFVLKSGKWSMTDVLIVAIMMAYIGFNGMVRTQFDIMRATVPDFNLISTNDTTLQIGFYAFLCYVILAMLLSISIERSLEKTASIRSFRK